MSSSSRTRVLLLLLHFLAKIHCCCLVTKSYLTLLRPQVMYRLLCPQDFPGKNTEVGCHLLQHKTFPNYVSCINKQILYH